MADDPNLELELDKRRTTFQLLMRCARRVDERARARINREAGAEVARRASMALLPHVDLGEGTRLTELAARVGVSKQAVSKLVAELAEQGVVELAPDPDDRRARRVRFTPFGLEAIRHGLGVLRAVEDELAGAIGAERLAALRDALLALDDALSALPDAGA